MAKKSRNQQVPVEKTSELLPPITNGPATTAHSATAQVEGWRAGDRTRERTRHNERIFLTRPEIHPTRGSNQRPRGATQEPQPSGLRTFRMLLYIIILGGFVSINNVRCNIFTAKGALALKHNLLNRSHHAHNTSSRQANFEVFFGVK
jgi:hypothetical protein